MKLYKKKIALLVATILVVTTLCSCSKGSQNSGLKDVDLSSYPINCDETLTFWMELPTNISATYTNFGETELAKELKNRTGINIEYVHPPAGQASESFSLMIASNDMYDIIQYNWAKALGGPTITIHDKVIMKLDDLIEGYAPNLNKYLSENPDIKASVLTDEGNYYVFPFIRGDKDLLFSNGPVIRRDWLEKVNLPIPETVDEVETTLRAFKNELNVKAPLTVQNYETKLLLNICQASKTFYVEDGKVLFGPSQPEYKEALTRLNKWYAEGLLDNNYVSTDSTLLDANMLNGVSGMAYASGGGGVGKWLETMATKGQPFDIVGIPFITDKKGNAPKFDNAGTTYSPYGSVAISYSCKYPELAAKFLDYGYGEEGHMLFNFGIEGKSYEMKDGFPTYTDEIMKNPEGIPVTQAMGNYLLAANNGAFVQDKRYIEQYYSKPQQRESLANWSKHYDPSKSRALPTLTYTADESSEYATLMTEIEKYVDENTAQYIAGIKSLDEFDKTFNKDLSSLKIERAREIVQAAYDRYKNRLK